MKGIKIHHGRKHHEMVNQSSSQNTAGSKEQMVGLEKFIIITTNV